MLIQPILAMQIAKVVGQGANLRCGLHNILIWWFPFGTTVAIEGITRFWFLKKSSIFIGCTMVRWWKVIQRWLVEAPTLVGWSVVISSGQPHQSCACAVLIILILIIMVIMILGGLMTMALTAKEKMVLLKVEEVELHWKGFKRWRLFGMALLTSGEDVKLFFCH